MLRRVKLGRCLDTLPERLTLAHQQKLTHHEFLELLLADEVTRRDTQSAILRARTAGLDPEMLVERWDDTAKITYDRTIFNALCSLRFVDARYDVVILGPVGVGETFRATALVHIAVRRGRSVHFERADVLLKRLKATRLDNSHHAEVRKLLRVDVLIIDDFLASGQTIQALVRIIQGAGASVAGVGALIEKNFEGGRALLKDLNVPIVSLAVIASLDNGITFA